MSELDFESRLGGHLRAYAQGGVRPVDRYAIAESMVAAGSGRRLGFRLGRTRWLTTRSSRRMALILVVAATVLAMAGGALLLSAGHPPAPMPTAPPSLPAASPTTPSPALSGSSGYEAIFMRPTSGQRVESGNIVAPEIDIVAMRNDGQERLVRHLSSSILPAGRSFRLGGSISEAGWIAISTFVGQPDNDFAWGLIDLGDPAREPQLVPSVLGGAWGPGGLFATAISCCWRVAVVDPVTGSTSTRINSLPGSGPDIIWAADGSGLLVNGPIGDSRFGIAPVAGGLPTPGVPPLVWARGSRWVAAGGATLSRCSACDKARGGWVQIEAVLGTATEWYSGELGPATLLDASFAADGRSIWLLLDRIDGARHVAVIARANAPGAASVVSTVDLGDDVAYMRFGALAADDSILAVVNGPTWLVTPGAGPAISHDGYLLGFVPHSAVDTWPGVGAFRPAPAATTPPASDPVPSPSRQ